MRFFKEYGSSYNWDNSKGYPVSAFLGIYIMIFNDGGYQFHQNLLIQNVLEATYMDNFNGFTTPIKVEVPIGTY